MSRDRREIPGREPWAIGFGALWTYVGCALASALFAGLLWLWLELVVPDDVFKIEGTAGRVVLAFGTAVTLLLLLLGPPLAWLLGNLLRRSASTAVHVIAFTLAGSVLGGFLGFFIGPDVAVTLVVTLGGATGLARLLLAPLERRAGGG